MPNLHGVALCWVSSSSHSLMMMRRLSGARRVPVWYAACSPTHPQRCSIPVQSRLQQRQSVEDQHHAHAADVGGAGGGEKHLKSTNVIWRQRREDWLSWVPTTAWRPLASVGNHGTESGNPQHRWTEKKHIPKAVQGQNATSSRPSRYHLGYDQLELVKATILLAWTSRILG